MTRLAGSPGRWLLLSAPALLAAGLAGGAAAASAALGGWAAAVWAAARCRRALYPRQRRAPLGRYFFAWAAGNLFLTVLCHFARRFAPAASFPGRIPAWAGAVFFSLIFARRALALALPRRAAWRLGAVMAALSLALC